MNWRVITGDCLAEMAKMDAGSFDAVITDPPYGMDYQSQRRKDKALWKPKIANDKTPFVSWFGEAYRVLADDCAALTFCRWDSWQAFADAAIAAGFTCAGQIVWDKVIHGMGDLTGQPAPQHELIMLAVKGRFEFAGNRPKSVIRVCRVDAERLVHPNEKPPALARMLLRDYANGQRVLDPFCGSGTTGVACAGLGRDFCGIEIDPGYAEIARKRIEAATRQGKLDYGPPGA